ncbi:mechanosensitive ion channel family protein [Aquamicrobium segne]|uniref:Mechanosensitive ion channel family protein n=1 Tax=Aquamicrobium segne TaxID=469547 RepID=A0ABW0H293_9HYPH
MVEAVAVKYWIIGVLILLACAVALALWLLMRRKQIWSGSIAAHIAFVVTICALILLLRQLAYSVAYDVKSVWVTDKQIDMAAIIAVALLLMWQSFLLINRLTHNQIKKGSDPTSARLISRILKLVIFLMLVLLFGEHFGIGFSGLLAFGGLGGIAIGVAGRDVLSNFFSGAILFFDRPFNIGDWISSPDRQIDGTVAEIGWRSTKIITFDKRPLYVPNALFSTISIENPSRMTNRRINTTIGLRYEDADKVGDVVNDIRIMLKNDMRIDQSKDLLIFFDAFATSSLNIMVYCFTKTTKWAEWLSVQQDIFLKIIEIVHARQADFAFPSQTVFLEKTQD